VRRVSGDERADGELAARFGALYTAAVADVLDALGLLRQTLPPALRPLERGMRLAGRAFAVKGRPRPGIDHERSITRILECLGAVPAGYVAVYATGDCESAHFGELSATALAARGAAGVVVDGGCRDVDLIVREGFPVFCRHTTPQDSVPRWELERFAAEVEIEGVRVATGDWIVGDADGIVVVPAARAGEVLEQAELLVGTENEIRAAVRAGMAPLDAYRRFGKF
jgi:4-hydroxy-4-methyl-2-oxoglutarate aldolase